MLQKLSTKDGLALQMFVSTSVTHKQMIAARQRYSKKKYKSVCLESFSRNGESYREAWGSIFDFLGLPATKNIMEMIENHGPSAKTLRAHKKKHMDSTSTEAKNKLKTLVREIDKELFDGRVAALEQELGCPNG
eukprot:m.198808 g.198808  ORF g.198808 m.198808 type:complete len:134 (+) comp15720_c1_seq4:594-995(+)